MYFAKTSAVYCLQLKEFTLDQQNNVNITLHVKKKFCGKAINVPIACCSDVLRDKKLKKVI
jgi:hypothetical protein